MLLSKTSISNLALSQLGITKHISNFDTDRSQEGNACRQLYDQVLQQVLTDLWWPCGTKFITLGLVETNPTIEWGFSYRYPSDCLTLRRILSGQRTDTRQSRVPFRVGQDENGGLIYTDMAQAQIEYTFYQTDPTKLSPDFIEAFALRLAAAMAPQITSGDPFKITQTVMGLYSVAIGNAKTQAANEEQPDQEPDSEFIRARGGNGCTGRGPDWLP